MFTTRGGGKHNMQMETKFLHLRDSVEFGTRFGVEQSYTVANPDFYPVVPAKAHF